MSKGQYNTSGSSKTPPSPSKKAKSRRVGNAQNKSPKPVNVHLCYDNKTSRLQMLPDTGADVMVLGTRHLKMLEIHKDSLLPPPLMDTPTADGSQMAPALGCFQATLKLGNRCLTFVWDWILQDHGQGQMRLVQCGSRFLTDAETRYATIELEMLAVTWAMSKCRLYLRCSREPSSPTVEEVSRPISQDETECSEAAAHVRSITSATNITSEDQPSTTVYADRTLQELRTAARADPAYGRQLACVVAARADQVQRQYDEQARPLPRLCVGQRVRIQDPTSHRWDNVGEVMGHGMHRNYDVRLPSGRVWWRNRRHLRPVPSPSNSDTPL
ncbi:hypothetical protein Pmani_006603 [Petrolisthes manimaculis]|uniref:Reverse transcriptase RNase H-like domain-containing protein n=1 Tax=Petrolisthes manimaculis TaxID=1843537 RepID=A0AAE1UJF0_9EUCA|nr:hypothetical protein Pmani_006603 [Petrolisthes manimaculis]